MYGIFSDETDGHTEAEAEETFDTEEEATDNLPRYDEDTHYVCRVVEGRRSGCENCGRELCRCEPEEDELCIRRERR